MYVKTICAIVAAGLLSGGAVLVRAADIGTAFTYQGYLEKPASTPVNDTCDFRFGLWNAAAGGNQEGNSPQSVSLVDVAGGVFSVKLDFGTGAINGAARWLAIEVQCTPDGAFVPLDSQRVELTPAPHAIRASKGVGPPNALEVDTATGNVGIGTDSPFFPLHVPSASVSGRAIYGQHTAATGVTYGVYGRSDSTVGRGVFGEATDGTGLNYGGRFESASTSGRGVYGSASAGSGFTLGVAGFNNSTEGTGVYGGANASTGLSYGVRGDAFSTSGRGVHGKAIANSGFTYGGYFESESPSGRGVFGDASASNGLTYGVYGQNSSTDGRAVYGLATANTGFSFGGYFESEGTDGRGVYGEASALSGTTYGVRGNADSPDGFGVYGHASALSGANRGVAGRTDSPDGFAGYFTGVPGSKNYFSQNVGIGTLVPDVMLHVDGGTDASLSDGSGFLVVGDVNSTNIVMDSNEIIARNNGAADDLFLNNGSGNVGILRSTTSHPLHVGTNSTNGNGAHLTAGGTWTNGSSRDFKQGFESIDKQALLQRLADLPVTRWQYKGEAGNVHHIGPVAQDFRTAFEVGHDARYITTIDADGVALAAIQGLYEIVQEKDCEIGEMNSEVSGFQSEISNLKSEISELKSMVKALAARNMGGP